MQNMCRYDPDEFSARTLIVVDAQNDFIHGCLGSKDAAAVVPNIVQKIKEYKQNDWAVIATQDTHHGNYLQTHEGKLLPVEHCIEGSNGWQIESSIEALLLTDMHIKKDGFMFPHWQYYSPLIQHGVIEVVGFCTDICVVSNALYLRAAYPENDIVVDSKCCAGTSAEAHEAALTVMRSCQIEVI